MSAAKKSGVPVTMHCSFAEKGRCTAVKVQGFQAHIGRKHKRCGNGRRIHAKKNTRLAKVTVGGVRVDCGQWMSGAWKEKAST